LSNAHNGSHRHFMVFFLFV